MGRILDRDFWDYILATNHLKEPPMPDPKRYKEVSILIIKDEIVMYRTEDLERVMRLMFDECDPVENPHIYDP
jgi:hypothetical protein